ASGVDGQQTTRRPREIRRDLNANKFLRADGNKRLYSLLTRQRRLRSQTPARLPFSRADRGDFLPVVVVNDHTERTLCGVKEDIRVSLLVQPIAVAHTG